MLAINASLYLQMPEKCCAPGCNSNYKSSKEEGYISVFRFPTEEENRKRWTRNIPRKDWTPSNRSVVCIKHFEECDVSRVEIYKDSDGSCHEFPRQRPLLLPEAVPKIFPGLPSYLNKVQPPRRCDPEIRRKRARHEEEEKNKAMLSEDIIANFQCLCAEYQDRINSVGKWSVSVKENKIFFYTIDFSEDIPQVKASMEINDKLISSVCVNGFILSHEQLSWILPSSLRVTRWSQI
ncbi:THAP domain-containing protein 5-like [Schistocerca piceifrons]|uniref:THAP domain-containing protein 5-like n=1 Tax=Schistocerca piceifrons TaxID=274613 RepID=UPI001F5F4183|nr:THAP domain-containing protein 5-like [Schistocerca piceifrons]